MDDATLLRLADAVATASRAELAAIEAGRGAGAAGLLRIVRAVARARAAENRLVIAARMMPKTGLQGRILGRS